jgi:hypothetical protein
MNSCHPLPFYLHNSLGELERGFLPLSIAQAILKNLFKILIEIPQKCSVSIINPQKSSKMLCFYVPFNDEFIIKRHIETEHF